MSVLKRENPQNERGKKRPIKWRSVWTNCVFKNLTNVVEYHFQGAAIAAVNCRYIHRHVRRTLSSEYGANILPVGAR
jgi:hypothetical protein